jgi:hypothetical protein
VIEIGIDDDSIPVGGFLTGRIRWESDKGKTPKRIVVAAEWQTKGKGDPAHGVGRATQIEPDATSGTISLRPKIPHEGPITYEGQLLEIEWKLRVRIDQPGFDEFGEAPFRVEVRRKAVGQSR